MGKNASIDHPGYVPPAPQAPFDAGARIEPGEPMVMTRRQLARSAALKALLRRQWPGSAVDLARAPEAQADPDPTNPEPPEPGPEPPPLTREQVEAGLSAMPMTLGRLPEPPGPIKPTPPPGLAPEQHEESEPES